MRRSGLKQPSVPKTAPYLLLIGTAGSIQMSDHVYKVLELVGSSTDSNRDAIQTAIKRADQTLRNMRWFEVIQTRGHV